MTPDGKRLWDYLVPHLPTALDAGFVSGAIESIEVKATTDEQDRIAGEYRKLRGYPPTGPGSGDEVLAIIERRGRHWDGVIR